MHVSRIMLDETDKKLLSLLQRDATLTAQALSEALNLSASQIGRRRQRLEAEGVIRAYTARLSAVRVGLGVQAFVQVQLATHGAEGARTFHALIMREARITGAWTLTGEADYLLRVFCADLAGLNQLIHGVLLTHASVSRVQSQIVMDQMKVDAPLPL